MTKETEGEESKYSSVLTSTSGIRPPTVEKPVHYDQIDINATKVNHSYICICTCAFALSVLVCSLCGNETITSMYTCLFFHPPPPPPPQRKAHPHGLLYDKVVPVPEGQGPKPNKMADDPKTHYADILPHTISFSPNTG